MLVCNFTAEDGQQFGRVHLVDLRQLSPGRINFLAVHFEANLCGDLAQIGGAVVLEVAFIAAAKHGFQRSDECIRAVEACIFRRTFGLYAFWQGTALVGADMLKIYNATRSRFGV